MLNLLNILKHVNPSKTGLRKFSQIQYFFLIYIEESKNTRRDEEVEIKVKRVFIQLMGPHQVINVLEGF